MKRDNLRLVGCGDDHRGFASQTNQEVAGIDAHVKASTIWVVDRRGRKVNSSTVLASAEGFRAGLGRWARREFGQTGKDHGGVEGATQPASGPWWQRPEGDRAR